MIKAVIWDFGGVFTSSPFEAFARYEAARGIPVGTIRRINSLNHETNAWALFEQSKVDLDAFDRLFAEEAAALYRAENTPLPLNFTKFFKDRFLNSSADDFHSRRSLECVHHMLKQAAFLE